MTKLRGAAGARASRERRKWTIITVVTAVLLVVTVAAYVQVIRGRKSLDKVTLCPPLPSSITVLVVDVTDPMNVPQRQDFLNQLDRLRASVPRYGQLSVYKVDATSDKLLQPILTRCNPGTAADANDATGNPDRLQKRWERDFKMPMDQAFERVLKATAADRSPIMESVQSVSLTELQKPGLEGKPRTLIVASDLLQNTNEISFYRGLPDPMEFTASAAFRHASTNLNGVDVQLWMLQRGDYATTQPRALPDLWDRIIAKQGGRLTRVYTVSG